MENTALPLTVSPGLAQVLTGQSFFGMSERDREIWMQRAQSKWNEIRLVLGASAPAGDLADVMKQANADIERLTGIPSGFELDLAIERDLADLAKDVARPVSEVFRLMGYSDEAYRVYAERLLPPAGEPAHAGQQDQPPRPAQHPGE
jgi:hypothetical protein